MHIREKYINKYTSFAENPKNGIAVPFAIFSISILLYLPSLLNGFVDWDDNLYILNTLALKAPWSDFIPWALKTMHMSNYHPITWISYKIDYSLWGQNPFGYHLTNIILNSFNAILVFLTIKKLASKYYTYNNSENILTKVFSIALITTVLFIIHPVHVESVSWVSERKDLLYSLFYLSSIYLYMKYLDDIKGNGKYYILALLLFIMSSLSKSMAVTLPAILLIIDLCPYNRFSRPFKIKNFSMIMLEKVPFFIISIIFSILAIYAQNLYGTMISIEGYPIYERILGYILSMNFYILMLIAPIYLSPYHPHEPFMLASNISAPLLIIAFIFSLSSIAYCLNKLVKGYLIPISTLLFFLITILPTSNLFQITNRFVAERYLYLPSIAFFILFAIITVKLINSKYKNFTITITILFMIVLSILNIKQQGIWQNSVTLWTKEIQVYGKINPHGYHARGNALARNGLLDEAIKDYSKSIKLAPDHYMSYIDRGICFAKQKKYELALNDFRSTIRLKRKYWRAYYNIGFVYEKIGDNDNAKFFFDFAEELKKKELKKKKLK